MKTFDTIAVFGCKATTLFLLDNLRLPFPVKYLITIDPEKGRKYEVADYYDLKEAAAAKGIEVYQARYYSLKHEEDQEHLRSLRIDIAFVIGWQRLIPAEVLAGLTIGAFGMHGSSMDLPLGRGRSPMNWSIIEGREIFYTNLFRYDPGVDSGDILDSFKFQITPQDTAETMHFKNVLAMKLLIERNIEKLVANDFELSPQGRSVEPTYYPKRSPSDSLIDWNMDVYALERFIRAVTRPFNGAFTFSEGRRIIIWDAQVFDLNEFGFEKVPVATVVSVFKGGKFLLRCFGGLLLINAYKADFEVERGMKFDNNGLENAAFPTNRLGFYDLPKH